MLVGFYEMCGRERWSGARLFSVKLLKYCKYEYSSNRRQVINLTIFIPESNCSATTSLRIVLLGGSLCGSACILYSQQSRVPGMNQAG